MRDPLHLGPYTKHIHVQFIWIQPHCYNKNLSVNTQDEQHFTSINPYPANVENMVSS